MRIYLPNQMILNWHCFYKNYCCSSCTGIMSLYFCIVGICCAVVRMSPRSFNRMISYLKLCMSCSTNNTCLRSATYHHIILGTKAVQRKLTLVIVILLFCQFLRTHSLARFTEIISPIMYIHVVSWPRLLSCPKHFDGLPEAMTTHNASDSSAPVEDR